MRLVICIFFALLIACGPQPSREPQKISYKITPQNNSFLVEMSHDGMGTITLPPDSKASVNYRLLTGTKDYPIRYEVTPKSLEPRAQDTVLTEDFFQVVGHGFLACLGNNLNEKKSVQIIWNAPMRWKFANSFHADQTEQNFEAKCSDLRKALYVGGYDLPIRKTWFGVAWVLKGKFDNLRPTQIEAALTHNLLRVRKFWNAQPIPEYYFVSIRVINSESLGGTAHFQSFQLNLPSKQESDLRLDYLITHEYFHHWNGLKINLVPSSDTVDLDVWWFVEGFTDYYAYKLSELEPVENKDFKNVKLEELKRNYRHNHTYPGIPYVQGRHIANKFEDQISRYSSGKELKHVMHEIIQRSQDPNFYLTRENILKVLCEGQYMSCAGAHAILKDYVEQGISL